MIRKILCFFNLHSYKDEIILGEYQRDTQEMPAVLREKCIGCGKTRNEVIGAWPIPMNDLYSQMKGKSNGTKRLVGPETSDSGEV